MSTNSTASSLLFNLSIAPLHSVSYYTEEKKIEKKKTFKILLPIFFGVDDLKEKSM